MLHRWAHNVGVAKNKSITTKGLFDTDTGNGAYKMRCLVATAFYYWCQT